jgi:VanZ family protein
MPSTLTSTREEIRIQPGISGALSTWMPVAVGLTVIFFESTRTMSAQHTSDFLRPWFTKFFGPMSDEHWDLFHHILRKSGHFIGYGTLGMLWLRAWLRTFSTCTQWSQQAWRLRAVILAVAGTFLTASADEYHQTFLPGRTGQFSDVLLDTTGALIFTAIVALYWRRRTVEGAAAK